MHNHPYRSRVVQSAILSDMLPHFALRLSGTLNGSTQTWSTGLRFRSATGGDPAAIDGIEDKLNTWRDAVRALHANDILPGSILAFIGAPTRITAVRCSAIGADGKETAVSIVEGSPLAIGGNSTSMPQQVALAISLDTGRPGASYRGRMYLPALGASIGGDGLLNVASTGPYATDMAQWIKDVGNAGATAIDPQLLPCVVSTTKNIATPITKVRVGNRLDIQRRRADKQDETYSVAMVPN